MNSKIEDFRVLVDRTHDLCVVGLPLIDCEFLGGIFPRVEAMVFGGRQLENFGLLQGMARAFYF